MAAHNPGGDPLRAALMRLSEAPAATAAAPQGSAPARAAGDDRAA